MRFLEKLGKFFSIFSISRDFSKNKSKYKLYFSTVIFLKMIFLDSSAIPEDTIKSSFSNLNSLNVLYKV